jgi:hypothetical protein
LSISAYKPSIGSRLVRKRFISQLPWPTDEYMILQRAYYRQGEFLAKHYP